MPAESSARMPSYHNALRGGRERLVAVGRRRKHFDVDARVAERAAQAKGCCAAARRSETPGRNTV